MKLYKITLEDDKTDAYWGSPYMLVVRAKNESAAREMAAEHTSGVEPAGIWLDPNFSECVEITQSGKPEVIAEQLFPGD